MAEELKFCFCFQVKRAAVDKLKEDTTRQLFYQQLAWERELDKYIARRPRTASSMEATADGVVPAHLSAKEVMTYLDYAWDLGASAPDPQPSNSRPGTSESAACLAAKGAGVQLRLGLSKGGGGRAEVLTFGEGHGEEFGHIQAPVKGLVPDNEGSAVGHHCQGTPNARGVSQGVSLTWCLSTSMEEMTPDRQGGVVQGSMLTHEDLVVPQDSFLKALRNQESSQDLDFRHRDLANVPIETFSASGLHQAGRWSCLHLVMFPFVHECIIRYKYTYIYLRDIQIYMHMSTYIQMFDICNVHHAWGVESSHEMTCMQGGHVCVEL